MGNASCVAAHAPSIPVVVTPHTPLSVAQRIPLAPVCVSRADAIERTRISLRRLLTSANFDVKPKPPPSTGSLYTRGRLSVWCQCVPADILVGVTLGEIGLCDFTVSPIDNDLETHLFSSEYLRAHPIILDGLRTIIALTPVKFLAFLPAGHTQDPLARIVIKCQHGDISLHRVGRYCAPTWFSLILHVVIDEHDPPPAYK